MSTNGYNFSSSNGNGSYTNGHSKGNGFFGPGKEEKQDPDESDIKRQL